MKKNKTSTERVGDSIGKEITVEIPLRVRVKVKSAHITGRNRYELKTEILEKKAIEAHIEQRMAEEIQQLTGQLVISIGTWRLFSVPVNYYLVK